MGTHIDNQALEKIPFGVLVFDSRDYNHILFASRRAAQVWAAGTQRSFWHTGMQGFLMVYIREIWIGYFRIYRRCLTERGAGWAHLCLCNGAQCGRI